MGVVVTEIAEHPGGVRTHTLKDGEACLSLFLGCWCGFWVAGGFVYVDQKQQYGDL